MAQGDLQNGVSNNLGGINNAVLEYESTAHMNKIRYNDREAIEISDKESSLIIYSNDNYLFWKITSIEAKSEHSIVIDEYDKRVYPYFEKLFSELNSFDFVSIGNDSIAQAASLTREMVCEHKHIRREAIEAYQKGARESSLLNESGDTITWVSDNAEKSKANILKIKKEGNSFHISITIQPPKENDNRKPEDTEAIIEFSTFASRYDGYLYPFINMLREMIGGFDPRLQHSIKPINNSGNHI